MTHSLDDALAVIQDHLERYMQGPSERATPLSPQEVDESLQWMSAANYGAAVHLSRLQKAGADLVRQDGKDMGLWIVEQVKLGNVARSTRIDYNKRHGLSIED
ncbi:hypothetical protein ACIQC9_06800 [Brevundimonas sp. NPDC092305]|uniref:hypothetical protein n=1 Tax=Brevundimonas sp. NPDC092305 TaxID=3363957 RepID=UPI00381A73BE